jgi:poly(ADP-ribose) glycohydrolase ARH3
MADVEYSCSRDTHDNSREQIPRLSCLLDRFAAAHQPWRRYGPSTESILRMYAQHKAQWRDLATAAFPHGSYGNGSAMRVAPIGLAYHADLTTAAAVAMESSRPTHSHPLAYQGAVIQCLAVGVAASLDHFAPDAFLRPLRASLARFDDLLQDTSKFKGAFDVIESGLRRGASCRDISKTLGTGITAYEAVPMALYCFLRHPHAYAQVIHEAVFLGGDTDTIASMAGAIAGAFCGAEAIPQHWRNAINEDVWTPTAIETLADRLFDRFAG